MPVGTRVLQILQYCWSLFLILISAITVNVAINNGSHAGLGADSCLISVYNMLLWLIPFKVPASLKGNFLLL